VRFGPESMPRLGEIAVNGRVLGVSALGSIGVGLLVSLLSGLRAVGSAGIAPAMTRDVGYTAAAGGGRLRLGLVGVQVALAAVLVVAAGLLVSSYVRAGTSDLGFEPDALASFTLPIKIGDGQSSEAIWNAVLAEVGRVPGVSQVAGTSDIPFTVSMWKPGVGIAGAEPGPILGGYAGFIVTPSYFSTIGARMVEGRDFAASDGSTAEGAVIVNETFARRFLEGRPAAGVPISVFGGFGRLEGRIVGVVADLVEDRVQTPIRPAVYLPHTQMPWMIGPTVVVRSDRPAEALLPDLRRAAAAYDGRLPVIGLGLMHDRASQAIVDPRFRAALFGAFAAVSLCLAATGLYGSLAHAVGRRRKELGIRMALGADARRLSRMVLRQGAIVGGGGLAVGLASAAALSRVLESFLFGVTSREPSIFIGTAAVLLAVSLLAALTPARRAASVDLVASLRHEN